MWRNKIKTIIIDYFIGDKILINGDDKLRGFITAINIRSEDYILYEVSYIYSGQQYEKWFRNFEFELGTYSSTKTK